MFFGEFLNREKYNCQKDKDHLCNSDVEGDGIGRVNRIIIGFTDLRRRSCLEKDDTSSVDHPFSVTKEEQFQPHTYLED